ncbi:hypothetical protein BCR34DRAFT_597351 [Clohesyomyces aquaticus]|uniref:Uncharacterized protein n=1 Tax=Clohesyomyces aquaticus TaxID=1231657 RepID=A0A1Y2A386_9PLEO|nr:hypothetical protein BCR34DRAFT_597351 [Clohesyomyces aquaticus]
MLEQTTIEASSAALSNSITKIIFDVGKFARQIRDSRHDMNAINADLVAIKTFIEIIHDDFTARGGSFPSPLLEPVSGILNCCGGVIEEVQKTVMKFSASCVNGEEWETKAEDVSRIQESLETLRGTLDISLDHVSLYSILASPIEASPISPGTTTSRNDPDRILDLLKRNDAERRRIKRRSEDRALRLDRCLIELRICAEAVYEDSIASECRARSDSLDPDEAIEMREASRSLAPTPSSESRNSGVGAWLENLATQSTLDPVERAESVRTRASGKAGITFYAESTTSGSYTTAHNKRTTQPRNKGKQLPTIHSAKHIKVTRLTPTTITPDPEPPIPLSNLPLAHTDPHPHSNPAKPAKAKARRLRLSPDQKVALDWDLRNLSATATPAYVERVLREGGDPNVDDRDFGSLILRVSYKMTPDIIRLLVSYGADLLSVGPSPFSSPLHAAVLGKNLPNVQCLVELGAHIDALSPQEETPLHGAVKQMGSYAIAKFLLEAGADTEVGMPLQKALVASEADSRERSRMVELLMAHGVEGELGGMWRGRRGKGLSVLGLI